MPWKVYVEESNTYEVDVPDSEAESEEEAREVALELVADDPDNAGFIGSLRNVTQVKKE